MKRKVSPSLAEPCPRKRATKHDNNKRNPLIQILSQYGILECIASHVFPNDLFALAAVSKASYRAIFFRKESQLTLLKKMQCDGWGVNLRKSSHKKSKYFYQYSCTENATCGTQDRSRNVETRSCINCAATTCDECRIHCVYQSIIQPPDEPDELPTYSGFVLLNAPEMGILSPAHLGIAEHAPWNPPYHDQGYLDLPLEADIYAAPEKVDSLLDLNLGKHSLDLGDSSDTTRPSSVIRPFWEATEQRKRSCCDSCFDAERRRQGTTHKGSCTCTLRNRFLDRWLCLRCYTVEETEVKEAHRGANGNHPQRCSCGEPLSNATARILCLWCFGEVDSPSPQFAALR